MLTPKEIAKELKVKEQTVMKWLRRNAERCKAWKVMESQRRRLQEVYRARHERR